MKVCTLGETGALATPTARPTGFNVDVGARTAEGTGGWTEAQESNGGDQDGSRSGRVCGK